MIHIIAGCFPNCTPDPSSGVSMNNGSNAALGMAAILIVGLVVWNLLFGKKG